MKVALRRWLVIGGALLIWLPAAVRAQDTAALEPTPAAEQASPNLGGEPPVLSPTVPWYQHLTEAAHANGLDVHLLHAVAQVESNLNPLAISRFGAVGLMQIMPATGAAVVGLRGTRQSITQQLRDPATNVQAGARYLRSLMDTFSNRLDLALAAYNAGTGNVRKAGNRVPSNGETPKFVKKVTALYNNLKAAAYAADASALAIEPAAPGLPLPVPEPQ